MDRQTVAQYGMIIVAVIVIAVVLILATPFGEVITHSITRMAIVQQDMADKKLTDAEAQKTYDEMIELFDTSGLLQPGMYNTNSVVCNMFGVKMINDGYISLDADGNAYKGIKTNELIGDYIMQSEIKTLNDSIFAECDKITLVRTGENTQMVGNRAFAGCDSLKTFIANEKLEKISDYAFSGCSSLKLVYLNKSIIKIDAGAFTHCPNLTVIKFVGTMSEWNNVTKEDGWKDDTLQKIVCTDGVITL